MADLASGAVPLAELRHLDGPDREAAATALATADANARAAGVTIRAPRAPAEFAAVCELFRDVWQEDPRNPSITQVVLQSLAHAGNYVSAAYDDETVVGGCVGFLSGTTAGELHSHIAGVAGSARGRSVGFALKTHQRAWAMARGLSHVTWTFDPLVRRNAYFNLAKLGARPRGYLVDFYGSMGDGINAGDQTDRLDTVWRLTDPRVLAASAGRPQEPDVAGLLAADAVVALDHDASGGPLTGSRNGSVLLVAVPPDIERLRAEDRPLSHLWRLAVRDVLGGLLADGAAISGFARSGWYVVDRRQVP
jgi:predicted GNAT superfamily acetyltransferase